MYASQTFQFSTLISNHIIPKCKPPDYCQYKGSIVQCYHESTTNHLLKIVCHLVISKIVSLYDASSQRIKYNSTKRENQTEYSIIKYVVLRIFKQKWAINQQSNNE